MPMTWNETTDAKLFAAVLKVHDVKLNYGELAKFMGPECSSKAITHRIAKIKAGAGKGSAPSTPSSAAKRVRAALAAKSRGKNGTLKTTLKRAKKVASEDEDDQSAEESEIEDMKNYSDKESGDDADTPSKSRTALRRSVSAKPGTYAGLVDSDSEDDVEDKRVNKKVKVESVPDEEEA